MNRHLPLIILLSLPLLCAAGVRADEGRLPRIYNQGRFEEAIEYCRAGAGESLQSCLDLAVILKDLADYDEALSVLRRARERFGPEPALLALLARLYYLDGKSGSALGTARELLSVFPDDIEANVLAGLCHEALGEMEKAGRAYEKVISLDKNNVIARLSLAQLYYRQDRLAESAENFRKVSVLDSSIRTMYACWGEVLYKLGNYREAFRIYGKLGQIDASNPAVKEKIELLRLKLGEDFFKGQHEKIVESRKGKSLLVKPSLAPAGVKQVSVGLLTGVTGRVKFKCPVPFTVRNKDGLVFDCRPNALYEISGGEGWVGVSGEDGKRVAGSAVLFIQPSSPEGCLMFFSIETGGNNFWADLQDRSFRGMIEVRANAGGGRGFDMINKVSLEEYLYSVVPSEMPVSWPQEALKAQAVAARSEAVRKLGRHKSEGFDFCADVHCQAYFGVEKESDVSRQAVDETSGVVMTAGGKVVDAVYSSTCGGHTQDNIFGEAEPISYLKGAPDSVARPSSFPLAPYALEEWLRVPPPGINCDIPEYLNASNFRWVRIYSAAEMKQLVDKIRRTGEILKIQVTRRNRSGHVEAIRIKGSLAMLVLEKELTIRKALGDLKSSLFKVEIKYGAGKVPEQFIFYGGGWGHGVGMCQAGACGLALSGHAYKEILRHYFDGVEFDKLY